MGKAKCPTHPVSRINALHPGCKTGIMAPVSDSGHGKEALTGSAWPGTDAGKANARKGVGMAIIAGCQEGKATPKLVEVKCPGCGECLEIFVQMGGEIGRSGTLREDAKCPSCGYTAAQGTPASEFTPY